MAKKTKIIDYLDYITSNLYFGLRNINTERNFSLNKDGEPEVMHLILGMPVYIDNVNVSLKEKLKKSIIVGLKFDKYELKFILRCPENKAPNEIFRDFENRISHMTFFAFLED